LLVLELIKENSALSRGAVDRRGQPPADYFLLKKMNMRKKSYKVQICRTSARARAAAALLLLFFLREAPERSRVVAGCSQVKSRFIPQMKRKPTNSNSN